MKTKEEKELWIKVFTIKLENPNKGDMRDPREAALSEADNSVREYQLRSPIKSNRIKPEDIIEPYIFSDSVKEAKELIVLLNKVEESLKRISNISDKK
jgi:hypothetical protein